MPQLRRVPRSFGWAHLAMRSTGWFAACSPSVFLNRMHYCGRVTATKHGSPWQSRRVLHFTDLHRAPAGTLQNRGSVEVLNETGARYRIDDPSDLIRQVAPALAISPVLDGIEHLIRDVEDSVRNDVLARHHREHWSAELRGKVTEAGARGFLAYLERACHRIWRP